MSSNVELIIGPQRCGKSEATELSLSGFSEKLYVATLWKEKKHTKSIEMHRNRRDSTWQLYEIVGDLDKDFINIDKILFRINHPTACLVDGLTTWAVHCCFGNLSSELAAYSIVNCIEKLIHRHPAVTWRLIDVIPDVFNVPDDLVLREICSTIHSLLCSRNTELRVKLW